MVVAQFHDQGLIPVKYLGVEQGVNIVGLPFVRTSVDHGTAFDIAGTGRADLACALRQAAAMGRPPVPVPVHERRTSSSCSQQDRTTRARERREVLAQGVRRGLQDMACPA